MKLCFLMIDNSFSGGAFIVYEHARRLQKKGHEVWIAFENPGADLVISCYPGMQAIQSVHLKTLEEASASLFDFVIATYWETAYSVQKLKARRYGYFVQGHEDVFFSPPLRTYSALVQQTWMEKNFDFFSISHDLVKMIEGYGSSATLVPNTVDFERFRMDLPKFDKNRSKVRVLIEGSATSFFKNIPLMFSVVEAVPEVEVFYLSPHDYGLDPGWRMDRSFLKIPYVDVPKIYASCDVLLKLSSVESFSLPVLEMFASGGTAIVSNFTGHEEYIKNDVNALVVQGREGAHRLKEEAVSALQSLVRSPEKLARLKQGATDTCKDFVRWDESSRIFEDALKRALLQSPESSFRNLPKINRARDGYLDYQILLERLGTCEAKFHKTQAHLRQLENSYSYRLGKKLTAPYRLLRSFWHSLQK